jgi:D-alanyl-D-alanine carboxypeptidase
MKKLLSSLVLVLVFIGFFVLPAIYVSNAHYAYLINRQLKYVHTLTTIRCTEGAPFFLKKILVKSIYMDSLTNQIAYTYNNKNYLCASGWSDFENTKKATNDTLFKYASLTKLFTADLIINLVNTEQLNLDDPIVKFIDLKSPLIDLRVKQITIKDLLQHSAGFNRNTSTDYIFNSQPWCTDILSEKLSTIKLEYEVGQKNIYSNEGYCILGKILENIYKKSYDDIVKHQYSDLKFSTVLKKHDNETYYNDELSDFKVSYLDELYLPNLTASADIVGTARDLNLALNVMIKRKPYNITSLNGMHDCNITQYKSCYGLAMSPIRYGNSILFNRDGVMPGLTTYSFVTERKNTFVLLTNSMPFNAQKTTIIFKDLIANELLANEASF